MVILKGDYPRMGFLYIMQMRIADSIYECTNKAKKYAGLAFTGSGRNNYSDWLDFLGIHHVRG